MKISEWEEPDYFHGDDFSHEQSIAIAVTKFSWSQILTQVLESDRPPRRDIPGGRLREVRLFTVY